MSSLLEIICAAEAAGELEEPVRKHRRYWVHPLHPTQHCTHVNITVICVLNVFGNMF